MAELPEWSAQALRYQGSDGPVKVMYFRSRGEVGTIDSFDQNSDSRSERPELGDQISYQASGASDTRDVFSGHLFNDPVEVLDSKNYKLQGEEYFEDKESALGDLASKFNNFPRVLPIDIESSYGPKYSYVEPELIKPSEEDDLLLYYFKAYATIAKDFEAVQDFPLYISWEGRKEAEKKGEEKEKKKGKKKEKEEIKEKIDKKEEEEKERKRILQKRIELDGMIWRDRMRGCRYQCALIFGITTKFNPSGMWIVEDIFYDEEERE